MQWHLGHLRNTLFCFTISQNAGSRELFDMKRQVWIRNVCVGANTAVPFLKILFFSAKSHRLKSYTYVLLLTHVERGAGLDGVDERA